MVSAADILKVFHDNLVRMCDDLIQIIPGDSDIILLGIAARNIPPTVAISNFGEVCIPYKKEILDRDEVFFLNMNGGLFEGVGDGTVDKFKTIYTSDTISKESKKIIWDYFTAFLKLAISYNNITSSEEKKRQ